MPKWFSRKKTNDSKNAAAVNSPSKSEQPSNTPHAPFHGGSSPSRQPVVLPKQEPSKGTLYIKVVGAHNLSEADLVSPTCDSYCEVVVDAGGGEKVSAKTQVARNTFAPVWNEEFKLTIPTMVREHLPEVASRDLRLEIFDTDGPNMKSSIGMNVIPMGTLIKGEVVDKIVNLSNKAGRAAGSLEVIIQAVDFGLPEEERLAAAPGSPAAMRTTAVQPLASAGAFGSGRSSPARMTNYGNANASSGRLTLRVVRAEGLRRPPNIQEVFVNLQVTDGRVDTTPRPAASQVTWEPEDFTLPVRLDVNTYVAAEQLKVTLFGMNMQGRDMLGSALIKLDELKHNKPAEATIPLTKQDQTTGCIIIWLIPQNFGLTDSNQPFVAPELQSPHHAQQGAAPFSPSGKAGEMEVRVIKAVHLVKGNFTTEPDPYVRVRIFDENYDTAIKRETSNPLWNEMFRFNVRLVHTETASHYYCPDSLIAEVYDKETVGEDHLIGKIEVDLSTLIEQQNHFMNKPITRGSFEAGQLHFQLRGLNFGIAKPESAGELIAKTKSKMDVPTKKSILLTPPTDPNSTLLPSSTATSTIVNSMLDTTVTTTEAEDTASSTSSSSASRQVPPKPDFHRINGSVSPDMGRATLDSSILGSPTEVDLGPSMHKGQLHVCIMQASQIRNEVGGSSSASDESHYVNITIGDQSVRTAALPGTAPVWTKSFTMEINLYPEDGNLIAYQDLKLELVSSGGTKGKSNHVMGSCRTKLSGLHHGFSHPYTLNMRKKGKATASIHFCVQALDFGQRGTPPTPSEAVPPPPPPPEVLDPSMEHTHLWPMHLSEQTLGLHEAALRDQHHLQPHDLHDVPPPQQPPPPPTPPTHHLYQQPHNKTANVLAIPDPHSTPSDRPQHFHPPGSTPTETATTSTPTDAVGSSIPISNIHSNLQNTSTTTHHIAQYVNSTSTSTNAKTHPLPVVGSPTVGKSGSAFTSAIPQHQLTGKVVAGDKSSSSSSTSNDNHISIPSIKAAGVAAAAAAAPPPPPPPQPQARPISPTVSTHHHTLAQHIVPDPTSSIDHATTRFEHPSSAAVVVDLKAKIADLSSQVDNTHAVMGDLRAALQLERDKTLAKDEAILQKELKIQELTNKLETGERIHSKNEQSITQELEDVIKRERTRATQLEEQLYSERRWKQELEFFKDRQDDKAKRELEEKWIQERQRNEEMTSKVDKQQERVDQMQKELGEAREELVASERRRVQLQHQMQLLEQQLQASTQMQSAQASPVVVVNQGNKEQQEALLEAEGRITELEAQLREFGQLACKATDALQQRREIEEVMLTQKQLLADQEKKHKDEAEKVSTLEAQIAAYKKKESKMSDDASTKIECLQTECNHKEQTVADLNMKLQKTQSELQHTQYELFGIHLQRLQADMQNYEEKKREGAFTLKTLQDMQEEQYERAVQVAKLRELLRKTQLEMKGSPTTTTSPSHLMMPGTSSTSMPSQGKDDIVGTSSDTAAVVAADKISDKLLRMAQRQPEWGEMESEVTEIKSALKDHFKKRGAIPPPSKEAPSWQKSLRQATPPHSRGGSTGHQRPPSPVSQSRVKRSLSSSHNTHHGRQSVSPTKDPHSPTSLATPNLSNITSLSSSHQPRSSLGWSRTKSASSATRTHQDTSGFNASAASRIPPTTYIEFGPQQVPFMYTPPPRSLSPQQNNNLCGRNSQ